LVEERERACDEEVLRLGNVPQVYAQGILNVWKLYLESPLVCMPGVTGSNLKRRIETIMKNRIKRELGVGEKLLLAIADLVALVGPLAAGMTDVPALWAQLGMTVPTVAPASSLPAFEVASIKPSNPGSQLKVDFAPGGRFLVSHATLRFLIKIAYCAATIILLHGGACFNLRPCIAMHKKEKDRNTTHFLNVDLDLDVIEEMDELLDALKPPIVISRFGTRAGLELGLQPESPESAIRGFVALVENLPPRIRTIWNDAKNKIFSIGIQTCATPHSTEFVLSSDALSLIHSISANVAFTVYAISEEPN
jgi:hypothetical protein